MGRDMAYDCWSCDLLCAASSPDLYRINLEQGRFLASLSSQSPAINVVSWSMIHGLVACGGEDGAVECFDMRRKSSVGRISTAVSPEDFDQEVTSLRFDENQGCLMAVGSSTGKDFEIDEQSKEYLALHPQASIKEPHLNEEHFESVSEDEEQPDRSASDASAESDSDNDMHNSKHIRLYEVKDDRHAEAFIFE